MTILLSRTPEYVALDNRLSALELGGGSVINALSLGAVGDGTTNDTLAIQRAIDAAPDYSVLYFPSRKWVFSLKIWRPNLTIWAPGSLFIMPEDVDGICIQLGEFAAGNDAPPYANINVLGHPIIDGNYLRVPPPGTDLTGGAFTACNVSESRWEVRARNSHNAAVAICINSNKNSLDIDAKDGGKSLILGGHYPNVDFNSSKYNTGSIRSTSGSYGLRLLDNCWGNVLSATIDSPSITGFVLYNQAVNESYNNIVSGSITGGCSDYGVTIGPNSHHNDVDFQVNGITGSNYRDVVDGTEAHNPTNNNIVIRGDDSGQTVAEIYSSGNEFDIDGTNWLRTFSDNYAVNVYGAKNFFRRLSLNGPATGVWKGVAMRSGSSGNIIALDAYSYSNLAAPYDDFGSGNTYRHIIDGVSSSYTHTFNPGDQDVVLVSLPGARFKMIGSAAFSGNLQGISATVEVGSDDNVQIVLIDGRASGSAISLTGEFSISLLANGRE